MSDPRADESVTESFDPFARLTVWLDEAARSEPNDPEAMTLVTVDASGHPHARMVLLKGCDQKDGLVFVTSANSAKGREIAATGVATALFHWKSLRRQVRADGRAELADEALADHLFAPRSRLSQIAAWASDQSAPLASREELLRRVAECEARFDGGPVPRPPHWRAYRLIPDRFEFWTDGEGRLHDRVVLTRSGDGWETGHLNP